ncbi:MAG: hypothetical protein JO112_05235 [Planctomycetes bacterium]|nr:hypothetical protein [Planctomycetota bacterium]
MITILNSPVGLLDHFARLCVLARVRACTVADSRALIEPQAARDENHTAVTARGRVVARRWGAAEVPGAGLALRRAEVTAVVVSRPRQLEFVRTQLPGIKVIALADSTQAARWFHEQGVRNHFVFSPRLLGPLEGNVFFGRPLNGNTGDVPPEPAARRQGLGIWIRGYQERFPDDFARFREALALLPPEVAASVQFLGSQGQDFTVEHFPSLRATIHLQSHGALDPAVTNSLSWGIPVVTDWQTVLDTYAEGVLIHDVTALVAHSPDELAYSIALLAREDRAVNDLSGRAYRFARDFFQASGAYLPRFRQFLARLE